MEIKKILDKASKLKIAVIGDLIEDRYIRGDVDRISPEAPVIVLNKREEMRRLGGAGNVFMNLNGIGVETHLYCNYFGNREWMPYANRVFVNEYPHAIKTRLMTGQHHLVRIDEELKPEEIEWWPFTGFTWYKQFEQNFALYDAIVLADYHKGCLSDSLINAVVELSLLHGDVMRTTPVIVDTKKDFHRYRHVTSLKCNRAEYDTMNSITSIKHNTLVDQLNLKSFIVTSGHNGINAYSKAENVGVSGIQLNTVDTCGAGDTVTAVLAVCNALDLGLYDTIKLANSAAAEVCKYPGVHAIDKQELLKLWSSPLSSLSMTV